MGTTQPPLKERAAITNWCANDNYTHAITLNTDRELTLPRLRSICSTFCHRLDKRVLRVRNLSGIPVESRTRAIFFPENLETNAHLHGLADFAHALQTLGSEGLLKMEVRFAWMAATRGAGSVHLESAPDRGWAEYSTKGFDGTYFLAADFHPQ
ncbi:hypothetical protein [Qipengyuania sp. 902]|uniref:hypothetical protein n=1 Tax=Qipengyuania sp. 902 TaxID=3417565 RepID=UPI003EBD2E2C